jgi:hypothetical protein
MNQASTHRPRRSLLPRAEAASSRNLLLSWELCRFGARGCLPPRLRCPKIPLNKRAPSACPYFYIYIADEAWQSSCQLRRNLRAIADVILVRVCSASCSWSARACRLITHSSSTSAFLLYLRRRCNGSCPSRNVKTRRMRRRCNGSHPSRPVAEDLRIDRHLNSCHLRR